MDEQGDRREGTSGEEGGPGPEQVATPGSPRRSRVRRLLLILAAVVVVAGGAAGAIAFFALKGTGDVIDRMIPGTANVYVTAYLDPAAGQKVNLLRMSREFPELRDSASLDRRIDEALDEALAEVGLRGQDVRPWLGSQIALAMRFRGTEPSVAFLIASKDEGAARAALDKVRTGPAGSAQTWSETSRGGVTIFTGRQGSEPDAAYAVFDQTAVIANDPAFVEDVIDTSQGKEPSLSSVANFAKTMQPLPGERLGLAYIDFRPLITQLKEEGVKSGVDLSEVPSGFGQLEAFTGLGATLSAQPNGVALDLTVAMDPSKLTPEGRALLSRPERENGVLSFVPSKTFALLAVTGFEETMESVRDELARSGGQEFRSFDREVGLSEVIGHLTGEMGIEIGPDVGVPFPTGALLLGVDDEKAFGAFLDRLARVAGQDLLGTGPERTGSPWRHEDYQGADIAVLAVPGLALFGVRPAYAVVEGMAIIAASPDEVRALLDTKRSGAGVTSAATFREAVGSHSRDTQLFYVDVQGVASAVRNGLGPDQRAEFDREAGANLRPMKALVLSGNSSEDRSSVRVFLLIP